MKNDYLSIRVENREYETECVPVRTHYCYLHGQLQNDLNYDLFEVTDTNSIAIDTETRYNLTTFGIIFEGKIEVRCENVDRPCIGYFWRVKGHDFDDQLGLICYADDADANAYAEHCMNEKVAGL